MNLGESTGAYIWESSRGMGSDQVSTVREDAKSYSNEWTMSKDVDALNYEAQALPLLRALSGSVSERLVRDGVYASTIGILVKTDAFVRRTRQMKLKESTNEEEAIYQAAQKLLFSFCFGEEDEEGLFDQGRSIRLIGVKADHLDRGEYRQISFFDYAKSLEEEAREKKRAEKEKEKQDRLREMMGKIHQRYGPEAVYLGNRKKDEAKG